MAIDNKRQGQPEVPDTIEGMSNPFFFNKAKITRKEIEEYLEKTIPGQWDEWNVRMMYRTWSREQSIMNHLEGGI